MRNKERNLQELALRVGEDCHVQQMKKPRQTKIKLASNTNQEEQAEDRHKPEPEMNITEDAYRGR